MPAVAGNTWGACKKSLLTIYRALIRSIIDYGSVAYNTTCDTNKQKLNTVQTQALQIACGAMRGTAAAALHVETGDMSLELRRHQQELQYALKIKTSENHPAKCILERHRTLFSKRYTNNTLPFYHKVSEFWSNINNIELEGIKLSSTAPWRLKQLDVDLSVTKIGNKNEHYHEMKAAVAEKLEHMKDHIKLYTDGSKSLGGSTAAAFCIPELNVFQSFKSPLPHSRCYSVEDLCHTIPGDEQTDGRTDIIKITKASALVTHKTSKRILQNVVAWNDNVYCSLQTIP